MEIKEEEFKIISVWARSERRVVRRERVLTSVCVSYASLLGVGTADPEYCIISRDAVGEDELARVWLANSDAGSWEIYQIVQLC